MERSIDTSDIQVLTEHSKIHRGTVPTGPRADTDRTLEKILYLADEW